MNGEISCGLLFKQISDIMSKNANNFLRLKRLTIAQLQLLFLLNDNHGGECPFKDLEKDFRTAQSSTAELIGRLEQKGFVEVLGSAADKRIKIAKITDMGRAACEDAREDAAQAEERLTRVLSKAEAALLKEYLGKILKSL